MNKMAVQNYFNFNVFRTRNQSNPEANQPFQVLIGRDLMSSWMITYNGLAGFVSISD